MKLTKSAVKENRRVVEILQNMIAREKRILAGFKEDGGGVVWFDYELEKAALRISLLQQLIGEVGVSNEN